MGKIPPLSFAALLLALPLGTSSASQKIDLNALIANECGPPGYRADSGCRIELGSGTFDVDETVRLGACTSTTVRNSVKIQGTSAGMMVAPLPEYTGLNFTTAGTTLQWTGPPGQAMFSACGASFFSLRDLTINGARAGVGVQVSADSRSSAISHFVELRNVVIDGAETGVYITGKNYVDQVDFVTLERVAILNVDIGYLQDSQQSVGGRAQTVEVVARKRGFEIGNGSLNCDNCYVGTAEDAGDDFIGFHLTQGIGARPLAGHQQISIAHSHMELERGRFIVSDSRAFFPITLIGNSYSLQCPTLLCEMRVVDSNSTAPLVMIGDVIQGLDQWPKARICHRGAELIPLGVYKRPEVLRLEWNC